jgi:Ca-activated chloride channel family protein
MSTVQPSGPARLACHAPFLSVIATVVLAATSANAAPAEDALSTLPRVTPSEMGSGGLLLRRDIEGETPGDFHLAPTVATEVEITVGGMIARATVRQYFSNPGTEWVEGMYVFPLPENAAVDHLRLVVGDRLIEGLIKEREEARRIYEVARKQGRKAGLLESERPNIFTTSIANIGPGEQVSIEIEYQQSLRYDLGAFSLRFPMIVGPRYIPGAIQTVGLSGGGWAIPGTDQVPDAARITSPVLRPEEGKINPVTLSIELAPGFPITDISSAYHDIAMTEGDHGAHSITLGDGAVPADRDFELTWRPEARSAPVAGLFTETFQGEHYLLAMVLPPDPAMGATNVGAPPREVVFVLDISGSMGGQSIRQAKTALSLAIDRLEDKDRFNLIIFNHTATALFASPRTADPAQRAMAIQFVDALEADGGTEMASALNLALAGTPPADYLRQIIFLTDGAVGNEAELFSIVEDRLGAGRLFTIGIGSAPNSYFMTKAAETGRGTFTHIGQLSEVTERMAALFAKLESPVMTDLDMAWGPGVSPELSRDTLPDLYAGEPVVVTAKLPSLDGSLTISGQRDGAPWHANLTLGDAASASGVSVLWARDRIDDLIHSGRRGEDPQVIRSAVIETALHHHLVSKYTSLVAVDVTPSRPDGTPLASHKLPHNLPHGWDFDKVFGETHRALPPPAPQQDAGLHPTPASATGNVAQVGGAAVNLPQGATPAPLQLLLGLVLILLGTFLLHLGRLPRPSYRRPS